MFIYTFVCFSEKKITTISKSILRRIASLWCVDPRDFHKEIVGNTAMVLTWIHLKTTNVKSHGLKKKESFRNK